MYNYPHRHVSPIMSFKFIAQFAATSPSDGLLSCSIGDAQYGCCELKRLQKPLPSIDSGVHRCENKQNSTSAHYEALAP
jgi:hypothetical protein